MHTCAADNEVVGMRQGGRRGPRFGAGRARARQKRVARVAGKRRAFVNPSIGKHTCPGQAYLSDHGRKPPRRRHHFCSPTPALARTARWPSSAAKHLQDPRFRPEAGIYQARWDPASVGPSKVFGSRGGAHAAASCAAFLAASAAAASGGLVSRLGAPEGAVSLREAIGRNFSSPAAGCSLWRPLTGLGRTIYFVLRGARAQRDVQLGGGPERPGTTRKQDTVVLDQGERKRARSWATPVTWSC